MISALSGPSRTRAYAPAVIWAVVIFGASSVPSDAIPHSIIFSQDKLIHLGVYAILGFLLYRGIRHRNTLAWTAAGWLTFGIGVVYGASDELHQHFVPGRSMDIFDLIADAIGVALAVGCARYLEHRRSRHS
jgi:VanZ family protein